MFYFIFFFALPLLDIVVRSTGLYPPPRLARRPNDAHTEGGGDGPLYFVCINTNADLQRGSSWRREVEGRRSHIFFRAHLACALDARRAI